MRQAKCELTKMEMPNAEMSISDGTPKSNYINAMFSRAINEGR